MDMYSWEQNEDTGDWLHEPKATGPLFQLEPTSSSYCVTVVPLKEHCPSYQVSCLVALIIPYIQPS